MKAIAKTDIKELKKLYQGKVRDIYEIDSERWLMVASDRLSAFDVVFEDSIPDKGAVLNHISNKWFSMMNFIPNHLLSVSPEKELPFLQNYEGIPERAVIVRKVKRLPVECVIRGYLFGSVFNEYQKNQTAGGVSLPAGLKLAEKLPEPIFTPANKAESGHDENIDYKQFINILGQELGDKIIEVSMRLYSEARDKVAPHEIILADTKFEFGLDQNEDLVLIDEILTPDSSRYWDGKLYRIGESPASFDKQFVRDYAAAQDWDKTPPAPRLPEDIIMKTRDKYMQIKAIIDRV